MWMSAGAEAAVAAGLLGLLIGSFLNVVVYRKPAMMYRDWLTDSLAALTPSTGQPSLWTLVFGAKSTTPPALEAAATPALAQVEALAPLNLLKPRSSCRACGHAIRWYENIPVFSYLALRGKCSACNAGIGLRYPLVELAVAALFALVGWRFGISLVGGLWAAFIALLVCQFLIDLDTQYLPDEPTYALLWLGLIGAALGWTGVTLHSAVWAAFAGYLFFWSIACLFHWLRGKDGMGHGDFKLLAALGAWLGADYLLAIVLVSSMVGIVLWVVLRLAGKVAHRDIPISFGPCLAGTGIVCFVLGPHAVRMLAPFAFPIPPL
ncbi:prepilin peptidase [Variovorax rhizosphaerae]|uniref:Prepilin leader peptidase/N-methyltransferase n=1 Tax=Variovorax rhizosphaerae TaxID=1836200 RepID=A0ABU8WGE2_9BURK